VHVERLISGSERVIEASPVGVIGSSLGTSLLSGRCPLAWNTGAVMVVGGIMASAEGFQVSLSLSYNLL